MQTTIGVYGSDASFVADACAELRRRGLHAEPCNDEQGPDAHILLLDIDGLEDFEPVVRRARAAEPQVLVVAAGTNPTPDTLIRLIRLGAYDFADKAAGTRVLAAKLRALSERAQMLRLRAEVSTRLNASDTSPDAGQAELHREVVRSNEELGSLNRRLQHVVAQLKTLYHMGHDLAENENWSDALDRFLMAFVSFMEAEGTALLLFSHAESVLATRAGFGIDAAACEHACKVLQDGWRRHPRGTEIHCLESYEEGSANACLDRRRPWSQTVIPLRHRSRPLGFLLLDKAYGDGQEFKWDYDFINTLQTIFAEEIANAAYISELRRLDRFNNKVLDNIGAGVVTTDLDGLVRYRNVSASKMCPRLREIRPGRAPAIHFNDLFFSHQYGDNYFARIRESNKDAPVLEVECRASEDAAFPARVRTARMYDDVLGGEVIVAIFEDLTDQKRLEAEVRRNDRLRVLGQLSAGVAHEIRNPLTGIATSAEVLATKIGDDEDKARFLRAMLDEIHRLDDIIRNLLDFARPARPQMSRCALGEVVEKVRGLVDEQARARGVAFRAELPDEDVFSLADPGQITQVLLNISLNAIQACDEGAHVKVSLGASGHPGARVARIAVEDDGPGVPPQVRTSLFDPFVTTKSRGSGLGLAISKQIMEDHQGNISCEFLNRGTRFTIELPGAVSSQG